MLTFSQEIFSLHYNIEKTQCLKVNMKIGDIIFDAQFTWHHLLLLAYKQDKYVQYKSKQSVPGYRRYTFKTYWLKLQLIWDCTVSTPNLMPYKKILFDTEQKKINLKCTSNWWPLKARLNLKERLTKKKAGWKHIKSSVKVRLMI